ncbi:hypothetical protein HNQ94_000842 [Salirhabdus euzebyi]|uniref:S1 motif domain-containing protein n=1 Tax=Salirhabdus euzebyi TaxID=394506 RepID=A0A841PTT6_9BACI|nr:S1-like domain-containing RNA-binding protein [Salirhabdus euzebyi]MBB6452397.1 hypothetical protein [Salirhabdus euzebyi]
MNNLLGTVQILTVARKIDTGYVLSDGANEYLLHITEATGELEEGQNVDVFLYQDKKGQIVATMTIPDIRFEEYGWAEVVEVVRNLGVFVNIGIQKEILVSKDDLPLLEDVWPDVEDELFVKLGTDKRGRLLAIPATESVFEETWEHAPESVLNTPMSGRVYRANKEGTTIITEEGYRGFIHHTERKREPRLGEWVKGRVIDVKSDGTLNLSLRPLKQEGMLEDADVILAYIEEEGGVIPFSDKTDPEDILGTFNISKAAFKRALGKLMKEKKIEQRDGKTYLKTTE